MGETELNKGNVVRLFKDIELPLVSVLTAMEIEGINLNIDFLKDPFQTKKQLWTADQFDWRGCIEYWIDRSMRYYYSFQSVMELHRIPYRQIQMVHLYTGYMWEQLNKRQIVTKNNCM